MTPAPSSAQREYQEKTERALAELNRDTIILRSDLDHVASADAECRAKQSESWKEVFSRVGSVERAVERIEASVTTFVADRDKADKASEGSKGRIAQVMCALIAACAALTVAYISWQAKQADDALPKIVANAVAEGVKQALAARN